MKARMAGKLPPADGLTSYDGGGEHRGLLTGVSDTLAGAFTATYDPDGKPTTVGYPGGLAATSSYDNDENTTRLTYAKSGTTWLTFTHTQSIHGQVRAAASPASQQKEVSVLLGAKDLLEALLLLVFRAVAFPRSPASAQNAS